jgi:hypothetical protein
MTKRKKPNLSQVPWTPFVEMEVPSSGLASGLSAEHNPDRIYRNSRYQVAVWYEENDRAGKYVHLSIKDHAKSARHDWRDLQRIKNELCGPETEGIELYPAESRLVDSANQWHLFVFPHQIPVGFTERLVADGVSKFAAKAVQRPFEDRPADCLSGEELDARYDAAVKANLDKKGAL